MSSMNATPSGERLHIGFFGRRNAGKSSLVNAVTGQDLAVVSETKGTTTDPVSKAMELLPIGPVLVIDTPGFDDEGRLGELRIRKTREVLRRTDLAVLVVDAAAGFTECDQQLLALFEERNLPHLTVWNKCDLLSVIPDAKKEEIYVSSLNQYHIFELKEKIAELGKGHEAALALVSDLVKPGDLVVLVIPIDKAAPKGRLILPQQQVIRDLLDRGAVPLCVRETELRQTLERLAPLRPALVITDSQVFRQVSETVPAEIPLTSFSILMARHKGLLKEAVHGASALDTLKDGDTVLISEGCTHHRQCGDIGSVKLPNLLQTYTGKALKIALSSGKTFPEELSGYALVIHCGGCMLNEREVLSRMALAQFQGVPITNYGIAIAQMTGILKRSIQMIPEIPK